MPARLVSVRRRADGHLPDAVARYLLGGDLSGLARRTLSAPAALPRRPTAADRMEASAREAEGVNGNARASWVAARDVLLVAWAYCWPGTRPWAWWAFDAPERRRIVGGRNVRTAAPMPLDAAHAYADAAPPRCWRFGALSGHGADGTSIEFESEFAYLERRGLLLPDEAEFQANDADDARPWDRMQHHLDGRAVTAAAVAGYPAALADVVTCIGLDLSPFAEHVADLVAAAESAPIDPLSSAVEAAAPSPAAPHVADGTSPTSFPQEPAR